MTADASGSGVPRFDVVLRGYDRRQVDEHVSRLQRALARMRADLEVARSQPFPVVSSPSAGFPAPVPGPGPQGQGGGPPLAGRPRPTPRPRPGLPVPTEESPDMIGGFTDRMQSILQAAEEEAAEIRNKARDAARAEADSVRNDVAGLMRQRDGVLAELTRLQAQLEGLLSSPTARMTPPPRNDVPGSPRSGSAQPQPEPGPSGGDGSGTWPEDVAGSPTPAEAHGADAAQSGADRPGAEPPAGSTPSASGASAEDERPGSSSNGSVQAGRPSPEFGGPSTAAKGDTGGSSSPQYVADGKSPSKLAAHRLPTGAYPAVGEKPASMRPRTEPDPEPGELFRPSSDTGPRASAESQRPADGGGEARTSSAPTARPDAPGDPRSRPAQAGDVEATVQVGAVRPSYDDTVLTPAVSPSASKRPDPNETPVDEAPVSGRSEPGGNGSGTSTLPASPSRSG